MIKNFNYHFDFLTPFENMLTIELLGISRFFMEYIFPFFEFADRWFLYIPWTLCQILTFFPNILFFFFFKNQ